MIIVSNTNEPNAFDSVSGCVLIEIDRHWVEEWRETVARVKAMCGTPDNFSELRLFDRPATYYQDLTPDDILEALYQVCESKGALSKEDYEALLDHYMSDGWFVWPSHLPFDLSELLGVGHEPMRVDLEEVILANDSLYTSSCQGDQQIQSQYFDYDVLLNGRLFPTKLRGDNKDMEKQLTLDFSALHDGDAFSIEWPVGIDNLFGMDQDNFDVAIEHEAHQRGLSKDLQLYDVLWEIAGVIDGDLVLRATGSVEEAM